MPHYDSLLSSGFERSSELRFPDRYFVNLQSADDEQRKSLHQKWRYHLKKSEKEGLSFEHARPDAMADSTALYEAMRDRKSFADHSAYGTLPALMKVEDAGATARIVLRSPQRRSHRRRIDLQGRRPRVYLYGATNDRALPLRAGYFMHWHIIRWLATTRGPLVRPRRHRRLPRPPSVQEGNGRRQRCDQPVPPVANYAAHRLPCLIGRAPSPRATRSKTSRRWSASSAPIGPSPTRTRRKTREECAEDCASVSSATTVIFGARLFGAGLTFLAQAAIARYWGAEALGEYLLIIAAVNLIAVMMPLGFETIGTYFAAEYRAKGEGKLLRGFMTRALSTSR